MPEVGRSSFRQGSPARGRVAWQGIHVVRRGDTLWDLSQRYLGDATRWPQIAHANGLKDPSRLRAGMVLRVPGTRPQAPAPNPRLLPSPKPAPTPGTLSRHQTRRWSPALAKAFEAFVPKRIAELRKEGAAMVCCDLAAKLVTDFCAQKGIANPLGAIGRWYRYTPAFDGGLPNVQSPHYFFQGDNADKLARRFTRPVPDPAGNGKAGFNRRTGKVDPKALRPGDILFYDWKGTGEVQHTVNVVRVESNGAVTIAYGSYNNLGGRGTPLQWKNLDMTKVRVIRLVPGTPEYQKWLGAGNHLWGARRYAWLPDPVSSQITRIAQSAEAAVP